MAVATCRTEGCPDEGIAKPDIVTSYDVDGQTHHVSAVYCGVCGQQITDVVPPLP